MFYLKQICKKIKDSEEVMMKKVAVFILSICMMGVVLTGCTGASTTESSSAAQKGPTISVTHKLGTVEVPINPKRVVVLDYSVLDTLDFLGEQSELMVPQTNLPPYLNKYKASSYKDAGDVKEPNVEAVNEFKPDLIIISGRQADLYKEFSAIAPTIYVDVDYTKYWDEVEKQNLLIGEIFGKKEAVEKKLAEIKTKVSEVRSIAKKGNGNSLIVMTNDGRLSAYGPGSRFGLIHDLLEIKPVDSAIAVSKHGMEIGFEYIAEKNPDCLFVVDRTVVIGGTNLASKTLDNDLVKGTKAGKNGKIVYLDPGTWYLSGYGLESVPMMLDEVSTALK